MVVMVMMVIRISTNALYMVMVAFLWLAYLVFNTNDLLAVLA